VLLHHLKKLFKNKGRGRKSRGGGRKSGKKGKKGKNRNKYRTCKAKLNIGDKPKRFMYRPGKISFSLDEFRTMCYNPGNVHYQIKFMHWTSNRNGKSMRGVATLGRGGRFGHYGRYGVSARIKSKSKEMLNACIIKEHINQLIALYTVALRDFYSEFKDLCIKNHNNIKASIKQMEGNIIAQTQETVTDISYEIVKSLIKMQKQMDKRMSYNNERLSINKLCLLIPQIQHSLTQARQSIFDYFMLLYEGYAACSCKNIIAFAKRSKDQKDIKHFEDIISNKCKCICK